MIDPRHPNYANHPGASTRPLYRYGDALCDTLKPLVSVVTTVWNVSPAYLHETARTVLGQSLRRVEWLLVNDASTDADTVAALRTLAALPGVRVIDHPVNRGIGATRNTGFANARTELVFVLDGDDLLEPTTLEKCLWYMQTHPHDSLVKGFSVGFGGQRYLWPRGFEQAGEFLDRNQVTTTAMIRASVHAAVGGHDETLRTGPDDWDFWLRCANAGKWGATIPEYLDWYRRRAQIESGWNTIDRQARREWYLQESRRRYPRLFNAPNEAADTATSHAAFNRAIAERFGTTPESAPPGPEQTLAATRADRPRPSADSVIPIADWQVNPVPRAPGLRRTLVVVDRFNTTHAAGLDLTQIDELIRDGDEVTVIATGPAPHPGVYLRDPTILTEHVDLPLVAQRTPDVFIARNYVPEAHVDTFVQSIARSREVDRVIRGRSPLSTSVNGLPLASTPH